MYDIKWLPPHQSSSDRHSAHLVSSATTARAFICEVRARRTADAKAKKGTRASKLLVSFGGHKYIIITHIAVSEFGKSNKLINIFVVNFSIPNILKLHPFPNWQEVGGLLCASGMAFWERCIAKNLFWAPFLHTEEAVMSHRNTPHHPRPTNPWVLKTK